MDITTKPLAAPPSDAPIGTGGWILFGVVGAVVVVAVLLVVLAPEKKHKTSRPEQEQRFAADLRTGPVTPQGFIRLTPAKYPALTSQDASRIADELGYYRQTFGTKGNWLFRPRGDALDQFREGTASSQEATGESKRSSDGRKALGFLLLLAGIFMALAHITNWLNGNVSDWIEGGDGSTMVGTHLLNAALLVAAYRLLQKPRPKRDADG